MKTARTLTVLSLIDAAGGLLGGVLIHHLAKTTQDQEKS